MLYFCAPLRIFCEQPGFEKNTFVIRLFINADSERWIHQSNEYEIAERYTAYDVHAAFPSRECAASR